MNPTEPDPIKVFEDFLNHVNSHADIDMALTELPETWSDHQQTQACPMDVDVFATLPERQRREFVRGIDKLLGKFPQINARRSMLIAGLRRIDDFAEYPFGPRISPTKSGLLGILLLAIVGSLVPWIRPKPQPDSIPEPRTSDLPLDVFVFPSPTEGLASGAQGRIEGSIRPSMFPDFKNLRIAIYSHLEAWRLEPMPVLRSTKTPDRLSWSGTVKAASDYAIIVFDPAARSEGLPEKFATLADRPPALRQGRWLLPLGNWDGAVGGESDIKWRAHSNANNKDGKETPKAKIEESIASLPSGNKALKVEYDIREGMNGRISAQITNAPKLSRSATVGFSVNFTGAAVTEFEFGLKTPSLGEMSDDHTKNLLTVRAANEWLHFRLAVESMTQKKTHYRNEELPESGDVSISLNDRDFVGKKGGAGSFFVDDAFILDVLP